LKLDYRSAEALWTSALELRQVLGLRTMPDHSTLWWYSRHKVKPRRPERGLTETLHLFQRGPAE